MTKLNIKEAVGRTSLWKRCQGDVDYSRNMYGNLVTLSFFPLYQYLLGITRGALAPPQNTKKNN